MIFRGCVSGVSSEDFVAVMKPDDGKTDEVWTIDRKWAPDGWLSVGAMFLIDVEADGTIKWTFDCSVWTEEDIEEIKRKVESLWCGPRSTGKLQNFGFA